MVWWLVVIMVLLLVTGVSFLVYIYGPWVRWKIEDIGATISETWDDKMDWIYELREKIDREAYRKYNDKH